MKKLVFFSILIGILLGTFVLNSARQEEMKDIHAETVKQGEDLAVSKAVDSYIKLNDWNNIYSHNSKDMMALVLKNVCDDSFKLLIYHDFASDKYYSFNLVENNGTIDVYHHGTYPYNLSDESKEEYDDVSNDMIITIVDTNYDALIGYCNELEQVRILQDTRSDEKYLMYTRTDTFDSALYSLTKTEDGKTNLELITMFYRNEDMI